MKNTEENTEERFKDDIKVIKILCFWSWFLNLVLIVTK